MHSLTFFPFIPLTDVIFKIYMRPVKFNVNLVSPNLLAIYHPQSPYLLCPKFKHYEDILEMSGL